jgi:RHS repeat-associated protein
VVVICFSLIGGVLQPNWPAVIQLSLGQQGTGQIFKQVLAADYQYNTTIKADSPSAYWPLDDGTGTTASDATGNGHGLSFNYTLHWYGSGLVAGSTSAIQGDCDTCHNAWLSTSSPVGLPSTRTFEIVFQCVPAHQCSWETHLITAHGTGTCTSMRLIIVSSSRVNADDCSHISNCDYGGSTGVPDINDGLPHLIDAANDGQAMRMYIDGVSCVDGGGTVSGQAITGADCTTVGADCGSGGPNSIYHETIIGQAALYPVALSATQISNHYAAAGWLPGAVTSLSAKASTNAASLTWTPPTSITTTPISSYTVTPIVDGKSSTPISVSGAGTGANVPNLPGGASYAFQVAANDTRGAGPSVTSNAVTIGSPTAGPGSFGTYLYLRSGQGNGQAFAHYGFVSRNNVPALTSWTFEARLWGFTTTATTGSHMAFGWLSGTTSSPSDQNLVAGLDFHIGGGTPQTSFVWPGGSCALTSDSGGIAMAFDSMVTTPAHVAESYDGTTVRGFINGTQVCSQATNSAGFAAGPFGFMDNAGLAQGYFDEIRVSSVARYTASFTPPTQRFATDGSTNLLWHFDDYAISKLPSTHILSAVGGPNYLVTLVPSTYRDASGNLNHANTAWASGTSSVQGNDDWYRPYSLGPGVTADELTGDGSPWLCPCTINSTARPVNDATGEFWHTFTDFHIPGRMPLDFTRTYSSLRTGTLGPTGYGWTDDYNEFLSFDGSGNATVHAGNGSAFVFTFTSPSTYMAAPSEHVSLVKNGDGTFTLTDTGQNQTVFNAPVSNLSTLAKLVDRHGGAAYTLTLAYNGDGTLATVSDPASRTLTFSYQTIGSSKLVSSVTDSATPARTASFQYGTNSSDPTTYLSLTQVTDVAGGLTKFTYDSNHYLLTMTDPNSGVTTNTYDSSSHRITSQKDPLQRVTGFSYAGFGGSLGMTTTVTDPKGNVVQEEYLNGMLLSRTIGYGTSQAATWTYAYDVGAVAATAVVGPNGETVTTVRDASANVLSVTDGLGRITSYTYNSFNEPLTVTDPLGVATTNVYNSAGDLTSTSRPLVGTSQTATTSYTFGDGSHSGDVTKMTDPDNNAWNYTYDTYGNRVSETDALGDKITYGFDTIGRMTSMVTPNGNVTGGNPANFTWTYAYDAFGNQTSLMDPLSHQTVYHYDPNQNLDRVTDASSNTTTNVYDADNELIQVKRADSPQTVLVTDYNTDGTVLDQKDGKGNAIQTYAYDSLAHVTMVTDALNNATTYVYDAYGDILSKQAPGDNCSATPATGCTSYRYDAANQLVSITYSDGVTPNVTGIAYDATGQRTAVTDGTGTSSWSWDSLHRMTSYTNGNGAQVKWAYNLRNLPTTITYPGSLNVTRGYDAAGRWSSVQEWNSNTTTFGYDANSNLTTRTFPSASGVVDTSTFNAADQLTGITSMKGSTTLFSATYTRDSANQLTSDSSAPAANGLYKYTTLNQLCYAGSSSTNACSSPPTGSIAYKYDAADNLSQTNSIQHAFNNADELCWTASTSGACSSPPTGATTYSYDARGNRTAVTPSVGQAQALSYDQANRLTSYAAPSTTSYTYNADGLRMSKTSGGTTTQFVWDVAVGLPLLLKEGTTAYLYGPGGLPLEQIGGGTTYYFHQDQIGSTRLVTDASGAGIATYQFDPFGNLLASSGSITNPFRFAGQYQDSESGLLYVRARFYEPATAQFLSRDPAVAATLHSYGYVDNNPLNRMDPTGLFGWGDISNALSSANQGLGNFVRSNASTIKTVAQIAAVGSGVLSLAALACAATVVGAPVCAGLEIGALALGATALVADSSLAIYAGGSWADAGLDALTMIPGGAAFAAAGKAVRYGSLFGRTLRVGCDASNYRAAMMLWRGATGVAHDIQAMGAIVDVWHGGAGPTRRWLGLD